MNEKQPDYNHYGVRGQYITRALATFIFILFIAIPGIIGYNVLNNNDTDPVVTEIAQADIPTPKDIDRMLDEDEAQKPEETTIFTTNNDPHYIDSPNGLVDATSGEPVAVAGVDDQVGLDISGISELPNTGATTVVAFVVLIGSFIVGTIAHRIHLIKSQSM